jgi:phosphoheptose isomerase
MTDLSPITRYLCEAIDCNASHLDLIAPQLESACATVTQCLLRDNRLFICGNGYSSPMATLLTTYLMHQQEFERPSLPALNISIDSTTISAIAKDGHYHQVYAKQLRALGREGDTLIALSIDGNCSNILQAIQTAHDRNIGVVTIIGQEGGKISALRQTEDIEVMLYARSVARAIEAQLMAINALCHQIEEELFGMG